MELLELFLQLIVIAFFVACLEMAFQYFMHPNMILYPYAVLLSWIAQKGEIWRHLMRPLGRCRYCNGIWISFYVFKALFPYLIIQKFIVVLLVFGLTAFFIRILSTYLFPEIDPAGKVDEARQVVFAHANTPYQAMLKSYAILGSFYALVFGLPVLI